MTTTLRGDAHGPGRVRGFQRPVVLVLLALVLAVAAWAAYRYAFKSAYQGASRIAVDLRHPELLLLTKNLAELPKDVAGAPMLEGLVDEALVFHYEEDEARLSLEGSLRRLAYEHDLELQDHLLSALLAAPAEVGIWRSSKGRPEHFVVVLERGALGKLVEAVVRVAADDRQLKEAGRFSVGGKTLPLLTLEISNGRVLGFFAAGDRWVFVSNPAMVLDEQNQLTADAADILGDLLQGKHPWQESLPTEASAKHSLVVGRKALTMNYADLLPAINGLRFNFAGDKTGGWRPEVRLNTKALPDNSDLNASLNALWRELPYNPALCAALPVNWSQVAEPLNALVQDEAAVKATLGALEPLGAVCWFAGSRFNAPLFVARAKGESSQLPPQAESVLAAVARKAWRVEGHQETGAEGNRKGGDVTRFSAVLPSRHGVRREGTQERGFELSLVRRGNVFYFSPDRSNVDAALAVGDKTSPALSDLSGLQGAPLWLFYDPQRLGRLVRDEVQSALPADEAPLFREVARQRLWPRLEAWGQKQPPVALVAGKSAEDGFVALDFRKVTR